MSDAEYQGNLNSTYCTSKQSKGPGYRGSIECWMKREKVWLPFFHRQ